MASIVFVKYSASTVVDGKPIRLVKDQAWDGGDHVVKARPELFNELPENGLQTSGERTSASPSKSDAKPKAKAKA